MRWQILSSLFNNTDESTYIQAQQRFLAPSRQDVTSRIVCILLPSPTGQSTTLKSLADVSRRSVSLFTYYYEELQNQSCCFFLIFCTVIHIFSSHQNMFKIWHLIQYWLYNMYLLFCDKKCQNLVYIFLVDLLISMYCIYFEYNV